MLMVLFVLQETEKLDDLLDAWEEAGAPGITVLPSIGLVDFKEKRALREDFPIIPNLEDMVESPQNHTRTLFSIVKSEAIADAIYEATIKLVGELDRPKSGIFVVLPVSKAYGIR